MNKLREEMIQILNISLFNNDDSGCHFEHWDSIWEEAKAHDIVALVYFCLQKNNPNHPLIPVMKKAAIMQSICQYQYFHEVYQVFQKLISNGIQIILLKGSYLRWYYPNPEFRTMSDVDILVKEESFETVKKILFDYGYIGNVDNGVHLQFIKKNSLPIEVHWRLTNTKFQKNNYIDFEENIWENITSFSFSDLPVYALSNEDNLFYLLIHLMEHTISSGFGLRQLCDIAVFLNSHKEMDWELILIMAKKFKIDRFLAAILSICMKEFNIVVPEYIFEFYNENKKYVELFLNEIHDSGVFGYKTRTRLLVKKITQYRFDDSYDRRSIFFPSKKTLCDEFNYAKKYRFLIPIAWVHRLFLVLRRKIRTFVEVNNIRLSSGEAFSISTSYKQRVKLIKWLRIHH